jgi:hypothetical protein
MPLPGFSLLAERVLAKLSGFYSGMENGGARWQLRKCVLGLE